MDLPKIDIGFSLSLDEDIEILTYDDGVCLTVLQDGMITHQIKLTKGLKLEVEDFETRKVILEKSLYKLYEGE